MDCTYIVLQLMDSFFDVLTYIWTFLDDLIIYRSLTLLDVVVASVISVAVLTFLFDINNRGGSDDD